MAPASSSLSGGFRPGKRGVGLFVTAGRHPVAPRPVAYPSSPAGDTDVELLAGGIDEYAVARRDHLCICHAGLRAAEAGIRELDFFHAHDPDGRIAAHALRDGFPRRTRGVPLVEIFGTVHPMAAENRKAGGDQADSS